MCREKHVFSYSRVRMDYYWRGIQCFFFSIYFKDRFQPEQTSIRKTFREAYGVIVEFVN